MEPECRKRQVENYKGTEQHRCINREASEFMEIVEPPKCEACPVRVLMRASKPPCQTRPVPPPREIKFGHEAEGFPQCPFRYNGADSLMCSITNLPVDADICGRCDAETRERTATMPGKVANYFGAIRRWVASGCPKRSAEEIEQLFETHCQGCDRYDAEKHACKNCGCVVSTDSSPLENKLAMATEHCPLGRF